MITEKNCNDELCLSVLSNSVKPMSKEEILRVGVFPNLSGIARRSNLGRVLKRLTNRGLVTKLSTFPFTYKINVQKNPEIEKGDENKIKIKNKKLDCEDDDDDDKFEIYQPCTCPIIPNKKFDVLNLDALNNNKIEKISKLLEPVIKVNEANIRSRILDVKLVIRFGNGKTEVAKIIYEKE